MVFDAAAPGGPDGKDQRDLWLVPADGTGRPTPLTKSRADETHPTVSPDGTRLAYSSNEDATAGAQIYVRPLNGGTADRVTDPANGTATEPVWNPVNDKDHRGLIAYTATKGGRSQLRRRTAPAPPTGRCSAATGSSGGPTRGLDAGRERGAVPQPRDHLPVRGQLRPRVPRQVARHRDARAGAEREPGGRLAHLARPARRRPGGGGAHHGRQPAHGDAPGHPGGRGRPRDLNLTILNEDPEADTNIDPKKDPLFQPGPDYDPWTERQSYTPDGRRIVVTRFAGPRGNRVEEIWLADADGGHPKRLELAGRGPRDRDTDPAFSPDGKYLAFTRISPGTDGAAPTSKVLIADVASGAITGTIVPPDTELKGHDAQPTWSSDGTMLAFTRDELVYGAGGNKHIWTVPVNNLGKQDDLSEKICPGTCAVIDDSPAFSPTGQHRLQPQERRRRDRHRRAQRHHRDLRVRQGLPGAPPRLRP
ncbi:hypothetical protein ACFQ3Z_24300 [Streptomyces nogalater]